MNYIKELEIELSKCGPHERKLKTPPPIPLKQTKMLPFDGPCERIETKSNNIDYCLELFNQLKSIKVKNYYAELLWYLADI